METGILIAAISAAGVIGTAVVQWRSNVKTLNSTSATMKLESEQRTAQAMREAEERREIRQEERDAEGVRFKLESQARWLEKRQELHEATLANLPQLITLARLSASSTKTLRLFETPRGFDAGFLEESILDFTSTHDELTRELLDRESKMDLYGSETSSAAYSKVLAHLARLSFELRMMMHGTTPKDTERVSSAKEATILRLVDELSSHYDAYVAAARADLRTNQ